MQTFEEFATYILENSRHNENNTDSVHIIVDYPKIPWDDWAEYMATLTWFSGIPLSNGGSKNCNVVFTRGITEALNKCDAHDYAIISYIGSFYYSDHDNNIWTYFNKFKNSDRIARGHLLFHPDKDYGRLHPQTIFLNLKMWRELGRPSFENYDGKVINYDRSSSNVHDDYTPHYVKAGEGYKDVKNCEQGEFISKALEAGHTLLNFDLERNTKFFCYPERRHAIALDHERNRNPNIVYGRNNEKLPQLNRKYDVIYAPAAGNLAERLYSKFGHDGTKLVQYDNNIDSILFKQQMWTIQDVKSTFTHYRRKKDIIFDECEYKPELVKESLEDFSDEQWEKVIKSTYCEFVHMDIMNGPIRVDPNKTNLIYLSNIFSYNFIVHKMKIKDIHNKFKEYCELPNTTIYGKNIFKDTVHNENHLC
jgi:hypothetical protein